MKRCFVIGPIGDKMATLGSPKRLIYEDALAVYVDVILPACQTNDLEAIRSDGIAVPGEITDQIFRHLYEDEVVIADVSGGNANVMYELGLRHTRNLLTVQIGEYGQLPFDVQALRTIMFSRSERGLIDARKQLDTVLRVGLAEGSDMLPATRVWASRSSAGVASMTDVAVESSDDSAAEEEPEDERGFIDRMAEIEGAFPILTETIEAIGNVLEQLGADAQGMGAEVETLSSSGASVAQRLTIITRYGLSLKEPADLLTLKTDEFANLMKGLDSNVKGVVTGIAANPKDFMSDNTNAFFDGIVELAQSTREGMSGLSEFGSTVGSMGHISKALRRPGQQMQKAIRTMAEAAALVDDWEAGVVSLRQQIGAQEVED